MVKKVAFTKKTYIINEYGGYILRKKIKVLIITEIVKTNSGQGNFVWNLAKRLSEKDYNITIVARKFGDKLFNGKDIKKVEIPVPRIGFLLMQLGFIIATKFINIRNFDIVHLNDNIAVLPHHIFTAHFVYNKYHKIAPMYEYESIIKRVYHWFVAKFNIHLEQLILKKFNKGFIVAVSEKTKQDLNEIGVINNIKVFENGVDIEHFSSNNKKEAKEWLKGKLKLSSDDIVLLFVGDFCGMKGAYNILTAMEHLPDFVKLVVVGKVRNALKKKVKKFIRDKRIFLEGFTDDTSIYYKSSDILLFPTLYDSCPLVILEALSSEIPVIVSQFPYCGISQIIQDGESGILLKDPTNAEEIKEKILFLVSHPYLRKSIGKSGRNIVLKYSWDRMTERYESLYQKIVDSKRIKS